MDIGVRLAYLVYANDIDAGGFPVLEHELVKASPLFYYMQQKGLNLAEIMGALRERKEQGSNS